MNTGSQTKLAFRLLLVRLKIKQASHKLSSLTWLKRNTFRDCTAALTIHNTQVCSTDCRFVRRLTTCKSSLSQLEAGTFSAKIQGQGPALAANTIQDTANSNTDNINRQHTIMSTPRKCSISLAEYDAYGFDIDHTLATYNIPNLFELLHTSFTRFLVEKKMYPKELLEPFHKYKQFCARGLIYDVRKGNFLKIADNGTILRVSHGTSFLNAEAIEHTYPGRHWHPTDNFINHVDNIGDDEYMIFDNFFDMIGTVVLSRLVELVDKKVVSAKKNYKQLFQHIREAYRDSYEISTFAANTGGFFPHLVSDPVRYINKPSEDTKAWLKSLRQDGKVVFFMSSSHIDFATFSLNYLLGDKWMDYFDIGITRARKPSFFHTNRAFLKLEDMCEKEEVETLERGQVYSQGNVATLTSFLAQSTGRKNPKVLYFGDSIRSDIYPAQHHAGWNTVAILAELDGELTRDPATQPPAKRARHEDACQQLSCGFISNSPWGSFYTDTLPSADKAVSGKAVSESARPALDTVWGYILKKYTTLVIPSLRHMTALPHDHLFEAFSSDEGEQWGFHPSVPHSLSRHGGCTTPV